jgi:hypothetical protein
MRRYGWGRLSYRLEGLLIYQERRSLLRDIDVDGLVLW